MRVLMIFAGKIWGGAEQYVLDLGRALREAGHEVGYVACNVTPLREALQGERMRVEMNAKVEDVNGSANEERVRWVRSLRRGDRVSVGVLVDLLNEMQPEVIHVHDISNVPFVFAAVDRSGVQTKVILTRHIARKSRVGLFRRRQLLRLHRVVFVSDLAKSLWMGANPWFPEQKCMVIHNSIPDGPPAPENRFSLREELRLPLEVPLVAFTGRVRRSKGCEVLLKAMRQVSDLRWHLVFVGACKPGNYGEKLRRMAKEMGIEDRVTLYGFTKNVRALIQNVDVGVAPSVVREACPLSPMEFMQAGKCVIATDNGAQPEYLTSMENGILVRPESVKDLADALRKVLEDTELREAIGKRAKTYFKSKMTYSVFLTSIIACYE